MHTYLSYGQVRDNQHVSFRSFVIWQSSIGNESTIWFANKSGIVREALVASLRAKHVSQSIFFDEIRDETHNLQRD